MNNCPDFTRASSPSSKSPQSYGGSSPKLLRIRTLHNLMHALTAKVKKVCNLTKCLALLTHLKDFGIAGLIGCRSWLQWPPFPSANHFESSDTFGGQDPLLVALADVANPSTDKDFVSVDNFNVNSGASRVTFTSRELLQCSHVNSESGVVIHIPHFRTSVNLMREHLQNILGEE